MKLLQIFIWHWQKYFSIKVFLPQIALLIFILSVNYYYNLEDDVIDQMQGYKKDLGLFAIVFVPYIFSSFLLKLSGVKINIISFGFWLRISICFALFTLYRNFDFTSFFNYDHTQNYKLIDFYRKSYRQLFGLILILFCILSFYVFKPKATLVFINSHQKTSYLWHYLFLLGLMLIPIFFVSFTQDFQNQYPYFKSFEIGILSKELNQSEIGVKSIIEVVYATRFFFVEFFFRGLLIFLMLRYFGEYVIIPSAMAYCAIHFGKPWVEATSSFFGGYILGLLALKTKNLYGGIVLHLGIALGMDLFALLNS